MYKFSIIVTHFFDFSWIENWIKQISLCTDLDKILEILIINQDRTDASADRLRKLNERVSVLEYPKSENHFITTGHDHAAVLNKAVLEAKAEYIVIFDSDAHPINHDWLPKCEKLLSTYDAILAQVPGRLDFSHPCFMVLKRADIVIPFAFDAELFSMGIDTGRLIGKQLIEAGEKVYFAPPRIAFNGLWGNIYIDSIYHHGNGSFFGAENRLRRQVKWKSVFFKYIVLHRRRYSLSKIELVIKKAWNKLVSGFRKLANCTTKRAHENSDNNPT